MSSQTLALEASPQKCPIMLLTVLESKQVMCPGLKRKGMCKSLGTSYHKELTERKTI